MRRRAAGKVKQLALHKEGLASTLASPRGILNGVRGKEQVLWMATSKV
ncbi:hypothetical protein [Chitinophaga defluvii]|uniref:Uncharacterized protein n=1 Tax=Chitinophaga defluvii TaxID=3163343 RepID=A0ABV2T8Z1_9BACT